MVTIINWLNQIIKINFTKDSNPSQISILFFYNKILKKKSLIDLLLKFHRICFTNKLSIFHVIIAFFNRFIYSKKTLERANVISTLF